MAQIFYLFFFKNVLLFYFYAGWGVHCGIYKSSYNISKISSLNSPFHYSPLSLIPGTVSTGLIFPFTYMCTQNLHPIHPPIPFPHLLPPPLVPTSPDRTCSALLFSNFVKEKEWRFYLRSLHREFPHDISMYNNTSSWRRGSSGGVLA
jgi:hypothetical protein